MVTRIPSGVKELDTLIQGGLAKGTITLISGTPGTGKSILCSQIAHNTAKSGKRCLYLNLEQKEGQVETQMKQFGWTTKNSKNLVIITVDSSDPKLIEYVLREIKNAKYDLIILDSLDSISSNPISLEEINQQSIEKIAEFTIPTMMDATMLGRMKLKKIFSAISKSGATALLTSERVQGAEGLSRDTISEFLCDGIIVLNAIEGEEGFRTLHIPKMRLTKQKQGIYSFVIGNKGFEIKTQDQ